VDQLTFRAGEVADAYVDAVMGESVARRDQASSSAAAARRRARRCPSGGASFRESVLQRLMAYAKRPASRTLTTTGSWTTRGRASGRCRCSAPAHYGLFGADRAGG